MTVTMKELRAARGELIERSTRRGLTDDDLRAFKSLTIKNPGRRVRVYSEQGFVPHAYKWRCDIQWIEQTYVGSTAHVHSSWGGAQRSRSTGSLRVVA